MSTLFNQNKYSPVNQSVLKMVNRFALSYQETFSKVKTQWLPSMRDFLREETGLRMHQKISGTKMQKDSNVSFQFKTDRDEAFIKLIDKHYPHLDFDEYAACHKLNAELKNVENVLKEKKQKPFACFEVVSRHYDDYFRQYDLQELIKTLFKDAGRTADIWGTYRYRDSQIEIYYIPLILFCQIHNLPLEHAILSTLVHEMAHAYHHMGKDKDGKIWTSMNATEKHIVEGMAEYFTWLFVEAYKNHHPRLEETYACMFGCLAPEYTCFKEWTPLYSRETIKSALLSTRRKPVTAYKDFKALLTQVKGIMN